MRKHPRRFDPYYTKEPKPFVAVLSIPDGYLEEFVVSNLIKLSIAHKIIHPDDSESTSFLDHHSHVVVVDTDWAMFLVHAQIPTLQVGMKRWKSPTLWDGHFEVEDMENDALRFREFFSEWLVTPVEITRPHRLFFFLKENAKDRR